MSVLRSGLRVVKDSVFRVGWPRTDRDRSLAMTESLFLHVHPVKVRRRTLKFSATLGLGVAAALLFGFLVVTGILLTFYYVPHPSQAYRSMKDLVFVVSYGPFTRNVHRWAAHGMVIVVLLHMCRIFYTGAYKPPRELNWALGLVLLALTLGLSFTGYLLPWDQLAYWAITVGTSVAAYTPLVGEKLRYLLLGGHTIGESALLRFYVLHCFVLPALMAMLIAVHVWRVRKDGGLARPPEPLTEGELVEEVADGFPASMKTYGLMALARGRPLAQEMEPEDSVFSWPHLMVREALWALLVVNLLILTSLLWDAPLEELADPTRTPNPAKAPWYFLGLQELVHYSALVGGVLVPTVIWTALFLLPYLDRKPVGVGVWLARERLGVNLGFTLLMASITILTVIGVFFRGPNWAWIWPW